ncbi:hypothetical protein CARUB_v10010623mg [Capsella rubella]|uniref:Uncharacterized protein n=1 Tax=Capsella rubella TaxID=81985 RepID=R0IDN6_9BRAS|nr:hypothetical protein CARUB_v10010623mg [Capsella rubella]
MAVSLVSSIILFLLFIILSLFVDNGVFAAQMKHRKLGGAAKETMAIRRNLEGNGNGGSKIGTPHSFSQPDGQKVNQNKPSETRPNQATAQRKNYIAYDALKRKAVSYPSAPKSTACPVYKRCNRSRLASSP